MVKQFEKENWSHDLYCDRCGRYLYIMGSMLILGIRAKRHKKTVGDTKIFGAKQAFIV